MRAAPTVIAGQAAGPLEGRTSGLLSVGELQQALRIARQQSSAEAACPPLIHVGQGDDADADPDLFTEQLADDAVVENVAEARVVDRPRRGTSRRRPAGGGPGLRVARRLLGRDPKAKPSSGRGDADWLTEFVTPAVAAGPPTQEKPVGVTSPDVRVSDAPRGLVAVFWRWVARVAVAVLLLAGVNQVFVRPFRTTAEVTAPAGIDSAAASQVAARFAADYLTHEPSSRDVASAAGAPVLSTAWSGTRRLGADLVQPGLVVREDATHVLVSVAARIAIRARTTSQTSEPSPSTSSTSPTPAVPVDRWVTLVVPVEATGGGGLRVSDAGPIFSGEPPARVTPGADGEPDSKTTAATAGIASTFLAAYARSDVSYLASPGVTLAGLGNTVQLVSLSSWTVITPTRKPATSTQTSASSGLGTGTVVWQLTGTDLRIAQSYSIALTSSQGRWYASAVSPAAPAQEG